MALKQPRHENGEFFAWTFLLHRRIKAPTLLARRILLT